MKKLILIFVSTLFVAGSFAQSIVLLSGSTVNGSLTVTDPYDPLDIHCYVLNNTANSTTMNWTVNSTTQPTVWSYSLCDNYNCYLDPVAGVVYTSSPLAAGDTMDMKSIFVSQCESNTGTTVFTIWVTGDSANTSKTITANGSVTANCASAISDAAIASVSVYPSPVHEMLTVNHLSEFKDAKVVVYDILGNIIANEIVQGSRLSIATANWHTGIYFVCVEMDGAKVLTKRIQKS